MLSLSSPSRKLLHPLAVLVGAVFLALTVVISAGAAPADTVGDRVFGQGGSFTSGTANNGGLGPSSLQEAYAAAVDAAGNVYVADIGNNRVLEYDTPLTTDTVADRVLGQGGSFTTGSCNNGGISASSLCGPTGLAVDAAGHLYVADYYNNRVLEYDSPLVSQVANRVLGQGGSFTTGSCNNGGISASSLCGPTGLAVDAAGDLYVADYFNNRVLEYDNPLTADAVADRVFGQGGSFGGSACNLGGISAGSLCGPFGVAVDAAGDLYVAETFTNNRVLEYDSPLTSQVANRVFGQGGDFTTDICDNGGISASSLCAPIGVAVDAAGHLYVADYNNNRVLEYDSPLTSQVANRVFGQGGSFTTFACNNGGISASSLCFPIGVAVDAAGGLYVADQSNNRVLEYDIAQTPVLVCDGLPATVIGTNGNDVLVGTRSDDVIVALGGNDVVSGLDGNDRICLGLGNDLAIAGKGNDRVFGEQGNDVLSGNNGSDFLDGGSGNFDLCLGGSGTDTAANCEFKLSVP